MKTRKLVITATNFDAFMVRSYMFIGGRWQGLAQQTVASFPMDLVARLSQRADYSIHVRVPESLLATRDDTNLAATIIRSRLSPTMPWPTFADCVLMNAAKHVEGRHNVVRDHALADCTCARCGAPLDLTTWRDESFVDYCADPRCPIDTENDR